MKKRILLALLAAMALSLTACGGETDSKTDSAESVADTSAAEEVTEEETEEEVIPTHAAFPEADVNAVTFDDGNFAFATIICDDDASADGTLSVEELDGNPMLKYTDTVTTADNLAEMVQKVSINVTHLLAPEQLALINSIEFDMYAAAEADVFVNDDGENVKVPGWIGGGGGTVAADGKWYSFADFAASGINEYEMERSDACHVQFKFLLASAGKNWDETVEDPNFLIMRWGMQNLSSMYIDNITFYDADGNSIPLTLSTPTEEEPTEEGAETVEEATESVDETAETEGESVEETVESDALS